jgi:hypothetical protein
VSDDDLITGYFLDELDPAQRDALESRLAADPALRTQAERMRPVVARVAALPPELWDGLPGPDRVGRTAEAPRRPQRHRRAIAAAIACGLVAAGIAIGIVIERPTAAPGETVALHALSGTRSAARATAHLGAGGRLAFDARHLPATPAGRYYELWLMSSDTKLVAVASFIVDRHGHATLSVPLPAPATNYRYLDLSLQQAADGPQHSGHSILRARI